MRIVKISDRLYRVYNNNKCKDAWIENGEIMLPRTPQDALTPTERQRLEIEIF